MKLQRIDPEGSETLRKLWFKGCLWVECMNIVRNPSQPTGSAGNLEEIEPPDRESKTPWKLDLPTGVRKSHDEITSLVM